MDVTCQRCSTAYEFDDALVSERGTTVKCTNCGHQFKVRRATIVGPPERWLVRTIDGRELEFRALRELQGAIAHTTISREDVLSRGGSRPRRLGSIAELEPFFANAGSPQPPYGVASSPRLPMPTPRGLGAVAMPATPERQDAVAPIVQPGAPQDDSLDVTQRVPTPASRPRSVPPPPVQPMSAATPLPGVVVSPEGAPPPPPSSSTGRRQLDAAASYDPAALSENEVTRIKTSSSVQQGRGAAADGAAPEDLSPSPSADGKLSAPSNRRIAHAPESNSATNSPVPSAPSSMRGLSDTGEESMASERGRRPGAARWIVGFVAAGVFALIFATVGRKFLAPSPPAVSSAARPDERIGALLQEGERALLDGDLEAAKEQFDKASALSERDPHVATDLARLAAVRADVSWLKVRLLPEGDPDLEAAKRELEQAVERARKAALRAAELAPTEPSVIRAQIDALRLGGDLEGARRLVSGISSASSQPDNALTLAELDLAEAKPDWATVVGRLRAALGQDQNLGRARSMLVYALARSGDVTSARAELEGISSLPRPHPLLQQLRSFITRSASALAPMSASASASAAPEASASAGKPAAGKAASAQGSGRDGEPASSGKSNGRVPDDYVAPNATIDTSDLPGAKHTPTPPTPGEAPKPPPTSTPPPPGVDTSDLPGFK